jgi:hypothetical protein
MARGGTQADQATTQFNNSQTQQKAADAQQAPAAAQTALAGQQLDAAKGQLGTTNQAAAGAGANAQGALGTLMPAIQDELNNPNYTPALDAVNASYDSASQQAGNQAARTGNTAGQNELQDKLAMDRGKQLSDTTASTGMAQKSAAMDALQKVYGTSTGSQDALYGMGAPTLGAGTGAINAGTGGVEAGTGAINAGTGAVQAGTGAVGAGNQAVANSWAPLNSLIGAAGAAGGALLGGPMLAAGGKAISPGR